jgi:alpha-mannosidase
MAWQVRAAESKLVQSEKMAALDVVLRGSSYPEAELDRAWDELLLSQHHDAWLVVANSDAVIQEASSAMQGTKQLKIKDSCGLGIRVYNNSGVSRNEIAILDTGHGRLGRSCGHGYGRPFPADTG